jgi:adenylylsulfate kinase-like enzyme
MTFLEEIIVAAALVAIMDWTIRIGRWFKERKESRRVSKLKRVGPCESLPPALYNLQGEKMIVWITGQPHSGKSTLAKMLRTRIQNSFNIDGDNLRKHFPPEEGYNPAGRRENIKRAQTLAEMLSEQVPLVVVSLVSPFKDMRDEFKKKNNVIEVYLHTTEIRGREKYFAKDYEPPTEDFIDIDTGKLSEEASLDLIMDAIGRGKA